MLSEGEILNNASAKEIILVILNSLLLLVLKKVYCIVLYSTVRVLFAYMALYVRPVCPFRKFRFEPE